MTSSSPDESSISAVTKTSSLTNDVATTSSSSDEEAESPASNPKSESESPPSNLKSDSDLLYCSCFVVVISVMLLLQCYFICDFIDVVVAL